MLRGKPTGQVGTFSLETTSQSKLLREAGRNFQEWRAPFASCIAEAQIAGEIDSTFDPTDLAEFLLASLEGTILRMKARTRAAALDRFKNIIFQTVFEESKK
jgi:TetR/AcrR family transcriptional repressor of nem operon